MDHLDKNLMIQIYEHYIKHLQKENEQLAQAHAQPQAQSQPQVQSVTLYVKNFSSCIRNAVSMYMNENTDVTNTAKCTHSDFYVTNESTNDMP